MVMEGIIYCYTSPSGKCYVGQTLNENRRKTQHKISANHTYRDYNKPFYKAIRKYGWDAFTYEILWKSESENLEQLRKLLNKYEEYYIDILDSYTNGYNCTHGGTSTCINSIVGHKLTEEHKKKLNQSIMKEVHQYDLNGNFISSFNSAAEAQISTGCDASKIIACCKGKGHTSKGFQWCYAGDTRTKYVPVKRKVIKKFGKDNPKSKIVVRIDESGKELKRWDSLMDVYRELNLNSGTLCRAIKHHWKCKGFYYKYIDN